MPATTLAPRGVRTTLLVIAYFNAISCLAGGVGLVANGLGFPLEWLDGTPFPSYVWPGILLGLVVGGFQVIAIVAHHGRYHLLWGAHAAAGLAMMTWIFGEIAMILVWSPLQGIYFAAGFAQTTLAVLALGAWPSPFLSRSQPQHTTQDDATLS